MRGVVGALALTFVAGACAGGNSQKEAESPQAVASAGGGAPTVTAASASAPSSSARAAAIAPPARPAGADPTATTVREGGRDVEIACNGTDDDGDGVVDLLLPTPANACRTTLPGACASGFAACDGHTRVCIAPPPTAEVYDGIDNDCNGTIDDVPTTHVSPRALIMLPRYSWGDAAPDIATMSASLAQAGIPFDRQLAGTDWTTSIANLDKYSLIVVPGYLIGAVIYPKVKDALEHFAKNGGVVVVMKPVGTPDQPQAWKLTGLLRSLKRSDVTEIHFDASTPASMIGIDSPEERKLRITEDAKKDAVEVYTFEPDPAAQSDVVAHAFSKGLSVGPAITRRPLGRGAIYAVGHDLSTYAGGRCYINCFEPMGDILRLFLEGAFRESAGGHVVMKHTVPGEASSVLLLTHDIDAPDAYNEGVWGPPGALQMATMERGRGVTATFNLTTAYFDGYYNAKTVQELCAMGMCSLGGHSVRHPLGFSELPQGTCNETRASYGAQMTLCGEVKVSLSTIKDAIGKSPRVWRSPYLLLNSHLFDTLAKFGIAYDSGFGIGDLPYNLPVDLRSVGFHQDWFHHNGILEFPVACEDGYVAPGGKPGDRIDLQATSAGRFNTLWDYVLLRNAQNRSLTTVLVHPSLGHNVPSDNLHVKVETVERLLDHAKSADVIPKGMEEYGDFWHARLDAQLEATYDAATGYTGTLVIGETTAPALTIEFGDTVTHFSCPACGDTHVRGKRVTIVKALPSGTKLDFVASVK
jgi:hypothetical protein